MNCAKIIFSIAILFASSRLWGLTWHYGESYRVGYDDYIEIVPEYSFYDTLIPTIPATTQGYISIPTSLKGRPVAGIGNRAFWGCSKLTEVNIPSGIVYIDLLAFNRCSGLEKVIISETVNDIGKQAFNKATSLKTIIFKGNAPAIGDNAFSSVNSLCTAYVMPSSTGWNVAIPGEWNGIKIAYMKSVNFNPNGGHVSASTLWLEDGAIVGSLPVPTRSYYNFNGWFTAESGGSEISADTIVTADVTYYAQWTPNKQTVTFDANYGSVSESLQKDYDSALGALPVADRDGYVFVGWFTEKEGGNRITEETIVSSDVTYYAHWVISPYVFEGDANWFLEGDGIWRSGKIENSQTSSMKLTLTNACNVSFAWKSSCEGLVKGNPYDYLSFEIDGVRQDFICGESDWQEKAYAVKGNGEHTLKWIFQKDEDGSEGEDCAWIRGVTWIYTDITVDIGNGKSVVVPDKWINSYADIIAAAGGDKAAALQRTAANGRKVWECFMLGVDPTKADDDFRITRFWMENGVPKFEFNHTMDGSENSFLPYVKPLGKALLSDKWRHVPDGGSSSFRFFTVEVVPPGCESSIVDEEDLGGVQLWENGPYWAECNVGATKPEEYGYYFWWGDTVGYTRSGGTLEEYSYSGVTWVSSTGKEMSDSLFTLSLCPTYYKGNAALLSAGYIDSTGNLASTHDAAAVHLGSSWRMPTYAEFDALKNNCTTTWIARNGVYGLLVTGKGDYADKSIFLPAAGRGVGSSLNSNEVSMGGYWSSTPDSGFSGYAWYFDVEDFQRKEVRCYGMSVRPVREFAK